MYKATQLHLQEKYVQKVHTQAEQGGRGKDLATRKVKRNFRVDSRGRDRGGSRQYKDGCHKDES
jgi:hypothetical protein